MAKQKVGNPTQGPIGSNRLKARPAKGTCTPGSEPLI